MPFQKDVVCDSKVAGRCCHCTCSLGDVGMPTDGGRVPNLGSHGVAPRRRLALSVEARVGGRHFFAWHQKGRLDDVHFQEVDAQVQRRP